MVFISIGLLKSQTQLPLAPGTPAYPQGKEL